MLFDSFPATDTVKPAVFLYNATNSPEKFTVFDYPEDRDTKLL
jgi:hypothetical protein